MCGDARDPATNKLQFVVEKPPRFESKREQVEQPAGALAGGRQVPVIAMADHPRSRRGVCTKART
jgi:hypothetical protein